MTRRTPARLAVIVLGYAAAWSAGTAAVWWKNRGVSEADLQAMSGMFACGDAVTFLAVASLVAIVPTVLVFRFVGAAPRFWRIHAIASLLLSLTGLLAAMLLLVPARPQVAFLDGLHMFAPIRVLAGPFFFLAFCPGLLPAAGPNRKISLLACLFELCTMGSFLVFLVHRRQ